MSGHVLPRVENLPHFRGLPGDLPVLRTVGFRRTQAAAKQAIDHGGITAVIGDAGLGKTFAVEYAVRTSGMPWVKIEVAKAYSVKAVMFLLLDALTGSNSNSVHYQLMNELKEELTADPHIVVIDEAQNLQKAALDQVRLLHDSTVFPLLLVGGKECGRVLRGDRQLADRVTGWVDFSPIADEDLFETLDAYHPFFAATDRDLLWNLNRVYAKGILRRWAKVLLTTLPLAEAAGTADRLTRHVAMAALSTLGGEE